jgi:hypothetical protein
VVSQREKIVNSVITIVWLPMAVAAIALILAGATWWGLFLAIAAALCVRKAWKLFCECIPAFLMLFIIRDIAMKAIDARARNSR